jgi:two-component system response regulator FlrC
VVDDEPLYRHGLVDLLRQRGVSAEPAGDGEEALRLLRRGRHRLVISDLVMPRLDGLGLLRALRREAPEVSVVVLTGAATVATAVAALREGATDVLEKPVDPDRLLALLAGLQGDGLAEAGIVAQAPAMRAALLRARRAAATEATVLLQGESGTGKELVARAIHAWSARAEGPFVALNCAALPETLVESELFGHERGAFTDARAARAGVVEQARGGTLLLDEIGELPLPAQAKLLRVLEERRVRRLGGEEVHAVDVRFLAATNRPLRELVRERRFREDLYFRLDVLSLSLPALRERPEDLLPLARHLLARWARAYRRPAPALAPEAVARLVEHPWPGNVRELDNVLHRALLESGGDAIGPEHLALEAGQAAPQAPVAVRPWTDVERELIMASLARTGGNRRRAAELIGMGERTLRNRLRAYREAARA